MLELRPSARFLIVVLSWLALAPGRAGADGDDATSRAQKHYQEGIVQFNLGHYSTAISSFEAAYALSPDPRFLFNVAQSHRLSGDCSRARVVYESYRRLETREENRRVADSLIVRMKECEAQQSKMEAERAHERKLAEQQHLHTRQAPSVSRSASDVAPSRTRWMPWVVTGVGVGVAAAGLILVAPLGGEFDSLQRQCGTSCDPARWSSFETREYVGYTLLGVGSAAAVGGLLWWYFGRESSEPRRVAFLPTVGGVAAWGKF